MIVVKGITYEAVQNRTNVVLETIAINIQEFGLRFAVEKTEAVAFTYRNKLLTPKIRFDE